MPTLQEILQPRRDIERRAVGRTTINRDVLMFFVGQEASAHVASAMSLTTAPAFD
jgi:hypothetical protein